MVDKSTDNLFTVLALFIKDCTGVHDISISRDSLIEDDLSITGDDAADLILAFSKKYEVDISNFNFNEYFYDEPSIMDVINFNNKSVKPFTVGHLEKAILAGRLDESVINS